MITVMKCEPASPLPLCNHIYYHYSPCCFCYPFCENEKGDIFFFCRPYKVLSYDDDNSTPSTRNEIFSKWQTVLTLGSWLLSAFCLSLSLWSCPLEDRYKWTAKTAKILPARYTHWANYLPTFISLRKYFIFFKAKMFHDIWNTKWKRVNLYKMTKFYTNSK